MDWKTSIVLIYLLLPVAGFSQTFYVATNGTDQPSAGSQQDPWATISYAIDQVNDGTTILVQPGIYNGRVRLDQRFNTGIVIRSAEPYQARLRHDSGAVVICFTCQGVTLEGFDIAHAASNAIGLVIQIQNSQISNVTLRNNIIHDSTNNDLLKINNGARDVLIEGNMFYNQAGSDEHIDVNSAVNITIRDNVFFNSRSQSITSSYVLVKDSNGNSDGVLGSRNIDIRRNIFFNWQGNDSQSFVRVGEDGTANFEADNVSIENNLMIGNSNRLIRSALTVQGSRNVRFTFNTVTGNLPSRSFAARLLAVGSNSANEGIVLSNNIWSDTSGTMGTEGFVGADVFDAPVGSNASVRLQNNLYFNGNRQIPSDTNQEIRVSNDNRAVFGDPQLPDSNNLTIPIFDGRRFAGNFDSIRAVFIDLARRFGTPGIDSAAINRAGRSQAPQDDILGARRGNSPDIGAFEANALAPPSSTPGLRNNTALPWLLLLSDD